MLDLKKQGKTIILTTHDMEEAEELCDEIAFIMEGRLIAKGTVESLQEMYEEENRYEIELGITPSLPLQASEKGIMVESPKLLANGHTMIHVNVAKTQRAEKGFGDMIAHLLPLEIKQLVRKKMELRKFYFSMVNGQTKSNQSII